ncbi:MAG: iron permease [Zetaproteobacteria bacterium CG2_30_46_52]|nr:MAG: iron permease [Zetaproteobacteria bacterium CG2_30_46_52]
MLSALIIVFREVLEMAMVLGLLFAATRGVSKSRTWILSGAGLGVLGALMVAFFMEALENSIEGAGEFVFNAVVLFTAALLLAWTVIWMAKHGREMSKQLRQVGESVAEGSVPIISLMIVSFAAVMREGSEAVFFLFGAAQTGQDSAGMLTGGLLGLAAGGALGFLLYMGLVRLPMKHVFSVMGVLLILLAAGMASQAAMNLVLVDMLPPIIDTVWDSSWLLTEDSFMGSVLHVLVGYDPEPSGIQMLVYVATLGLMAYLYKRAQTH